ncbi:MAG TPA: hypothetical protein VGP47_04080 [Parachlamydiaceae bacterium]|nr:hypothetical protein [Parachlamydiaceae bacterium]
MKYLFTVTLSLFLSINVISADEFTISTYNCGSLSSHYDYLRGVSMQKLMQERHIAEPENMALNDKIQKLAVKILFSTDSDELEAAKNEWDKKGYQKSFEQLTAVPSQENSPNTKWNKRADEIITTYQIRPVVIHDSEVSTMLTDHLSDLTKKTKGDRNTLLEQARGIMATRIFANHLKYDIICLQEADYLNPSMFPAQYEVLLGNNSHSVNGIAWNKDRFEQVDMLGDIMGRLYAVKLQDKQSGKTVLVASGHISGCNPYRVEINAKGIVDSSRGDTELKTIIELFNAYDADFKVIGMDSNVTSLHPRLNILKESNYRIDYENYLDATCTNPYQVLNTRIDWIAVQEGKSAVKSIVNIPVLGVGLNSMQTNISDHKPVAAKITY